MKTRHIYYILGALVMIIPFLGMSLDARRIIGVCIGLAIVAFTYYRFVLLASKRTNSTDTHSEIQTGVVENDQLL